MSAAPKKTRMVSILLFGVVFVCMGLGLGEIIRLNAPAKAEKEAAVELDGLRANIRLKDEELTAQKAALEQLEKDKAAVEAKFAEEQKMNEGLRQELRQAAAALKSKR